MITALHTKKIISYIFSKRMFINYVLQTFNQAKQRYHIPEGIILHTDLVVNIQQSKWKIGLKTIK
ncbi:hypothetical protein FKJ74_002574 [Enterococcus faecalis]|uniref:hypothetical protein n=1 Tax=Enterococcus TaxID=1350 RepID=UPI0003A016F1|nr:hypothetical protein [Enterococcus faecalis]EGO2744101.1 hypothetical protein [Enterococcus faecalis]EGO2804177.1 hypothetical protein [Enterococcus faecalis]EGO2812752.1 hypothetical protein [Enterococcus faecalis]EGO2823681.1 hypothetical protein [Enterococcus faecalis]EGO2831872.1 hypothetical protein [Enterococcus faecalis]